MHFFEIGNIALIISYCKHVRHFRFIAVYNRIFTINNLQNTWRHYIPFFFRVVSRESWLYCSSIYEGSKKMNNHHQICRLFTTWNCLDTCFILNHFFTMILNQVKQHPCYRVLKVSFFPKVFRTYKSRAHSFTSLKEDLRQDIKTSFVFSGT